MSIIQMTVANIRSKPIFASPVAGSQDQSDNPSDIVPLFIDFSGVDGRGRAL